MVFSYWHRQVHLDFYLFLDLEVVSFLAMLVDAKSTLTRFWKRI